jgi:hypothetical protein
MNMQVGVHKALGVGRIEALQATAEALADVIDGARPELVAAAAGRLQVVLAELAALGAEAQKGSKADELKARRNARRSTGADSAPAARRGQPRRRGGGSRAS